MDARSARRCRGHRNTNLLQVRHRSWRFFQDFHRPSPRRSTIRRSRAVATCGCSPSPSGHAISLRRRRSAASFARLRPVGTTATSVPRSTAPSPGPTRKSQGFREIGGSPLGRTSIRPHGNGASITRFHSPRRPLEVTAEMVVDRLFPGDPLVCAALDTRSAQTQPRDAWRGKEAALQFIVANPMTAETGLNQSGRVSARCHDNATKQRTYLVIEFDRGTLAEQAAILGSLSTKLTPLTLVVWSGGKSLHGWFQVQQISEYAKLRFFPARGLPRSRFVPLGPGQARAYARRPTRQRRNATRPPLQSKPVS